MPDGEINSTADNSNSSQPANSGNSATQSGATSSASSADAVELAKKVGQLEAENQSLKDYQQKVNPVLETIWGDEETLKFMTDKHNKRLGVTPADNKSSEVPQVPVALENKVNDTRNSQVADKVTNFYSRHKINDLGEDAKKDINLKVTNILMETLDPMGNKKSLAQVLEDVPLTKLDGFLDNAYYLATKDDREKQAEARGKQQANLEAGGIIGSMSSESVNSDNLTLTAAQKKVADAMGIPHDKYLKNAKEISSRGNSIY